MTLEKIPDILDVFKSTQTQYENLYVIEYAWYALINIMEYVINYQICVSLPQSHLTVRTAHLTVSATVLSTIISTL